MDTLLVAVPGSRRPITVRTQGFVATIETPSTSTSTSTPSSLSPPSAATMRRKPRFTYKSPSSHDTGSFRVENPSKFSPPTASSSRLMNGAQAAGDINPKRLFSPRPMYIAQPSRSFYHPQGRLARSLPGIDPETMGIANPLPITIDDPTRRSSSRARRPAAKLRELNADPTEGASTVFAPASTAETLSREKPSPRKRRAGGQGGKRKRREVDDADGTYPAKRTRNARGAAAAPPSEVGSHAGSVPPGTTADASEAGDALEEKAVPERRSTRARAAAAKTAPVRRNSSASEGTQTSVSVSIAAIRARKEKDADAAVAEMDIAVAEIVETSVTKEATEKVEEIEETPAAALSGQEPMDVVPVENGGAMEGQESARKPEAEAEAEVVPPAGEVSGKPEPEPEDQKEEGELSEDGELPA